MLVRRRKPRGTKAKEQWADVSLAICLVGSVKEKRQCLRMGDPEGESRVKQSQSLIPGFLWHCTPDSMPAARPLTANPPRLSILPEHPAHHYHQADMALRRPSAAKWTRSQTPLNSNHSKTTVALLLIWPGFVDCCQSRQVRFLRPIRSDSLTPLVSIASGPQEDMDSRSESQIDVKLLLTKSTQRQKHKRQ